jgi:hypothetical protein
MAVSTKANLERVRERKRERKRILENFTTQLSFLLNAIIIIIITTKFLISTL